MRLRGGGRRVRPRNWFRRRRALAEARKWTFSSIPESVDTSTDPNRLSVAMTSSTRTSGAEAPAVSPTAVFRSNHSRFYALPSATR